MKPRYIAREEPPALYATGRNVAGSILGLDATGEDVDGTGLVWEVGDADQCCRAVADTLGIASWLTRPTAQVLGTLYALDGDPRWPIRGTRWQPSLSATARGLRPAVAVELEFYLLERDTAGSLQPACGLRKQAGHRHIDAYGLGRLDDMPPLFDDFYRAARALNLPVRT